MRIDLDHGLRIAARLEDEETLRELDQRKMTLIDLAALAISHGATLVSFDNDFARFPNLRRAHPERRK